MVIDAGGFFVSWYRRFTTDRPLHARTHEIVLATEATGWLHGAEAAAAAAETARRTFEQGGAAEGLPTIRLTRAQLQAGYPLLEALLALKLISSKSDGRRHLVAGAVRINNTVCEAERALSEADVVDGGIKLSVGRKRHGLITV
jgi:tyrosyl-tRNA synthetase